MKLIKIWICYAILFFIHLSYLSTSAAEQKSKCTIALETYVNSHNLKDAKHALEMCLAFAKRGDAEAQHHTGWLYTISLDGTRPDEHETLKWMKLSAEQGYANAQRFLANMYEDGFDVEKNIERTLYWYHKAAEQDDILALLRLGHIYHKGLGTPVNGKEAVRWYERAAEKNVSNAIKSLIKIYSEGLPGFPADPDRAKYWQQRLKKKQK